MRSSILASISFSSFKLLLQPNWSCALFFSDAIFCVQETTSCEKKVLVTCTSQFCLLLLLYFSFIPSADMSGLATQCINVREKLQMDKSIHTHTHIHSKYLNIIGQSLIVKKQFSCFINKLVSSVPFMYAYSFCKLR